MSEIQSPIRELLCQRCSAEYPIWSVTNDLWNATVQEGEHFFCPTCFTVLADERKIVTKGIWRLRLSTMEPAYRLATVEADALRLRNALEIYANEENWLCEGCESGICLDHQPRIWGMRPELGYVIAREALTSEVKAK